MEGAVPHYSADAGLTRVQRRWGGPGETGEQAPRGAAAFTVTGLPGHRLSGWHARRWRYRGARAFCDEAVAEAPVGTVDASIPALRRGVTVTVDGRAVTLRRPRWTLRLHGRVIDAVGEGIHVQVHPVGPYAYDTVDGMNGRVVARRRGRRLLLAADADCTALALAVLLDTTDMAQTGSLLWFCLAVGAGL